MPHIFYDQIAIGLIGAFLFRFRNPNRKYIDLVTVSILLVSFIPSITFTLAGDTTIYIYELSVLILIISYVLRFLKKNRKGFMDYLKFLAAILFASYPIMDYFNFVLIENDWDVLAALTYLVIPIVGAIYLYDRWILKPEPMKKRFIIALVAQTLIILVAFVYAFVQQIASTKNAEDAVNARILAEKERVEVQMCQEELERLRSK